MDYDLTGLVIIQPVKKTQRSLSKLGTQLKALLSAYKKGGGEMVF